MFEFSTQATIEHVNVRRGPHEDSKVAVDVKLGVENLPTRCAAAVLRADKVSEVDESFFDDKGEARIIGLTEIPISESWEGAHWVKISTLAKMRVDKLHKVVLSPRAKGLFDATLTVTVEDPPEGYVDALSKKLHTSCPVKLEQEVQELPLKQKDKGSADQKPGKVTKTEPAQQTLQ